MREQVCLYMCPWPRIQAALTDEHALNVTYRYDRGEPRGSVKKNAALREQGLPAGDCIDCRQCVAVCPTGVDIRDGPQLGCIQCGLCIDACDAVMAKVGRPPRLIAYDTDINIAAPPARRADVVPDRARRAPCSTRRSSPSSAGSCSTRWRRGRARASASSTTATRSSCACRTARCAMATRCASSTRSCASASSRSAVQGWTEASLDVVGSPPRADGRLVVEVGPDQTREIRVLVTARRDVRPGHDRHPAFLADRCAKRRPCASTRSLPSVRDGTAMRDPAAREITGRTVLVLPGRLLRRRDHGERRHGALPPSPRSAAWRRRARTRPG